MEIKYKHNAAYSEVIICDGNTSMSSGLLDENERLELAKDFISVLCELLPEDYGKEEEQLCDLLERL